MIEETIITKYIPIDFEEVEKSIPIELEYCEICRRYIPTKFESIKKYVPIKFEEIEVLLLI